MMEIKLDFQALLPKSCNPSVIMRKTSSKTQLGDVLHNIQPVTVKTSRLEQQGRSKKLSPPREASGDMTTECSVAPGRDSGTGKGQEGKTNGIGMKYGIWFITTYQHGLNKCDKCTIVLIARDTLWSI